MSHIRATAEVPPRSSISRLASGSRCLVLGSINEIIGQPNSFGCGDEIKISTWHERLAYALEHSSVKRARLLELVGVSPPTVHDWLHGKIRMIQGDHLIRVCEVLRISPSWLITGKGLMLVADRRSGERRGDDRRKS